MRIDRKPAAIVMTATITPSAKMPGLTRSDPAIRLQDYAQALQFYLSLPSHCVDRIVFLENSDTNLDRLRQLATNYPDKKAEFINVSSDYPPEYGKGYGEFKMLDEGLAQCRSIAAEDVFWKITGRLKIANLQRLIETAPAIYQFYCDLRDVPLIGEKLGGNQWMELRVFSCTKAAYDRFLRGEYYKTSLTPDPAEKIFFQTLKSEIQQKNHQIVPRFALQPIVEGYSGYGNISYQSRSYQIKDWVRKVGRVVTPWLWL